MTSVADTVTMEVIPPTREQIIDQFVKDQDYRAICIDIAGQHGEDLYHDLVMVILELSTEKLQQVAQSCFKCFFYKVARNQYHSTNSQFHKKYRKPYYFAKEHHRDIQQAAQPYALPSDATNLAKITAAMDDLYWYDREILQQYLQKGTVRALSEASGIPHSSLVRTISSAKAIIRKKVKKL